MIDDALEAAPPLPPTDTPPDDLDTLPPEDAFDPPEDTLPPDDLDPPEKLDVTLDIVDAALDAAPDDDAFTVTPAIGK